MASYLMTFFWVLKSCRTRYFAFDMMEFDQCMILSSLITKLLRVT